MSNPLNYLGRVKPTTRQIAKEVNDHLNKIGKPLPRYPEMGSSVMWGYNAGGAEHGSGRAIDFMIRNSPDVGDAIADFIWANRERYDLTHIIWRQRIKSTKTQPGVWRKMADRGSPTENHMDHPHVFFGPNPKITGTPKKSSVKPTYFQPKGVTMTVKEIQRAVGSVADGRYGDNTKAAVAVLQRKLGVTADGLWGPKTERAYKASSIKPVKQAKKKTTTTTTSRLTVDGKEGPATVKALQRMLGVKADGIRGKATNRALQKWVGVTADGIVGPRTVRALQKKVGAKVDGKWGRNTTKALQRHLNKEAA